VPLVAGGILISAFPGELRTIIDSWLPVRPFSGLVLSLPAAALYLLVVSGCLYSIHKRGDDSARAVLVLALFSFITLALLHLPGISLVMFTALSLSLLVGILATSYDMAYRDELTGLLGRRALNDRLRGLAGQFVIAMMDVDHFKQFNDTHGHDIGDEVLKMVARHIGGVGGGGSAYRYGGEEFCVVFAGKDMEFCRPFLEAVRVAVEEYHMQLRDRAHRPKSARTAKDRRGRRAKPRQDTRVSVTISIGMAAPDSKNNTPGKVLGAADRALYRAKKRGRNRLAA